MLKIPKAFDKNLDWILFVAVLLLLTIGLSAIYSVDLSRGSGLVFFKKQIIALVIGLFLFFGASFSQSSFFKSTAKLWYLFSLVLLVLVLFFGNTVRGTTGWFSVGGFSFQPAELAKVGIILFLAYVVSSFGKRFERPLFFVGTGLIAFVLIFLIMLQPDLGSAFVIGCIWFGIMLLVGARKLHVFILVSLAILALVLGWFFFFEDYQKLRLETFVNPQADPLGSGYNVSQSIIAIGSGQFLGRGLGFGSQSQLRFLPEAQTDFIFPVIAEEMGFAGASVLVILFGIIFWRLYKIIKISEDNFASVAVSGILILFFVQFFVNLGASMGVMPVTGITLPFVSYGGSSLIINLFLLGVVQSMAGKR